MTVDEFESLRTMMDRAMMLEARNMAWQEEGTPPWGYKGIARNNNWARPNSPSQSQELIKSDPTTHSTKEIKTPADPWQLQHLGDQKPTLVGFQMKNGHTDSEKGYIFVVVTSGTQTTLVNFAISKWCFWEKMMRF